MFVAARQTVALASDGGGEHVDPRADDVLAITEAATVAGRVYCQITLTALNLDDSKALFVLQHRNADDDETLESVVVAVPVDDTRQYEVCFVLAVGEWVSVVPYIDLIGTVLVAISSQCLDWPA